MLRTNTLFIDKVWQIISAAIITVGSMLLVSLSVAPNVSACDGRTFLGLPPWYDGLTDGSCNLKEIGTADNSMANFIWRIALNVIEALMMLVGYASVVMIIVGGFFYMTATGQADKIKSAKGTIMNAVIGLIISLSSVGIVNVIQGMVL